MLFKKWSRFEQVSGLAELKELNKIIHISILIISYLSAIKLLCGQCGFVADNCVDFLNTHSITVYVLN